MMWTSECEKDALLELLSSNKPLRLNVQTLRSADSLASRKSSVLSLLWREKPTKGNILPTAVVVRRGEMKDFFAWVATYVPLLRPFTSYCRVLEHDDAVRAIDESDMAASIQDDQDPVLGLILGEYMTYTRPRHLQQATLYGCLGTFSFLLAQVFSARGGEADPPDLLRKWRRVRELTKQARLPLDDDQLVEPWSVLMAMRCTNLPISLEQDTIRRGCFELRENQEISTGTWRSLSEGYTDIQALRGELSGPKQERVVRVEAALKSLTSRRMSDKRRASFIAGYLMSRVDPGSFSHHALAVEALPDVLMWYGLCAGLSATPAFRAYSDGLGWRILRELSRVARIDEPPRCDISLAELEVLSASRRAGIDWSSGIGGHLDVEVIPLANTMVRRRAVGGPPHTPTPGEFFSPDLSERHRIIPLFQEFEAALKDVNRLKTRLKQLTQVMQNQKKKGRK